MPTDNQKIGNLTMKDRLHQAVILHMKQFVADIINSPMCNGYSGFSLQQALLQQMIGYEHFRSHM